jgi:hypothetical protein
MCVVTALLISLQEEANSAKAALSERTRQFHEAIALLLPSRAQELAAQSPAAVIDFLRKSLQK